ncbi:MAG: inorganic phosphate transporter [Candidatus Binatia bacterium]
MNTWVVLIVGATLFVAYANGANDNFKGVATLFGSGISTYRKALWWGTITTLAGSITALFLATKLISIFQGNGLVPSSLTQPEPFVAAVILGAAFTVLLATKTGIPISTTHSLTGALFGGGFVAVGINLGFTTLAQNVFLPLLLSPLVAVTLTLVGYPPWNFGLRLAGFTRASCVCLGNEIIPATVSSQGTLTAPASASLRVVVDDRTVCAKPLSGVFFGVSFQSLLDGGHFLSAGAVGFARGLNDTPKIVALGLIVSDLNFNWCVVLIAVAMALGGLLSGRKVGETVGKRITAMEPDQGFMANLVTGFLVIVASRWGMPVSTTHVSCGSLFGIGLANGQARWEVIRTILLAWLLTLPVAGLSAGLIYAILFRFTET